MSQEVESWMEEKQSATLYTIIAKAETHPPYQKLFSDLADMATQQAELWAQVAQKHGISFPQIYTPNLRTRIVIKLIHWLGPRKIRPILAAMKVRGLSVYSSPHILPEGHSIPTSVEEIGGRHKGSSSVNNLRAAIFGINDGLVSNASLIMGIAGASGDPRMILLAGLTGGLAGAFSMAAGEYVSVRSQKEMFEYQIGLEEEELKQYPKEEAAELALIYKARGLAPEEAVRLADRMIADPKKGLETLAREELGLDPNDLTSPWGAAISSFVSFAVGALIPLTPYLIGVDHGARLTWTMALTGTSLFLVGSVMSLFTGRNAFWSGFRMVLIGGGAGVLTYLIGNLF